MPAPADAGRISQMAILMGFEFFLVLSGVSMAVMPRKVSLLVFFPAYGLFAFCLNALMPDNSIMWLYLGVVLNRMRFAFHHNSPEVVQQALSYSFYAATVYGVSWVGVAVLSPIIPRMGLTPEFLAAANYHPPIGGIFTRQPQTAMCAGVFYYVMLTLRSCVTFGAGFKNRRKARKPSQPPP